MPTNAGHPLQVTDILAAGAVITRPGREVLLVHRPRYDDWSFPKGKLDPGEQLPACAIREVEEETGLRIRLGPPLPVQRYLSGSRTKVVHYWLGRVVGEDRVEGYTRGDEIDEVVWVPWDEAARILTYPYDRRTLGKALPLRRRTHALVVLRHAQALARKGWDGDDRLRPLTEEGDLESERLAPILEAYGVTRVVSSSAIRCVDTVAPYAGARALGIETSDGLTEEEASVASVTRLVAELLHAGESSVLCTHRPVLPAVFAALGMAPVQLEKGGMVVVHHRKGGIVATEEYGAP